MKHLKAFNEAFLIPKGIRGSIWKDEEVAIKLLDKLKNITNGEELNIEPLNRAYSAQKSLNRQWFIFKLDGFVFDIGYTELLMIDGDILNVSKEICKKIKNEIIRLYNGLKENNTKSDNKSPIYSKKSKENFLNNYRKSSDENISDMPEVPFF